MKIQIYVKKLISLSYPSHEKNISFILEIFNANFKIHLNEHLRNWLLTNGKFNQIFILFNTQTQHNWKLVSFNIEKLFMIWWL